MSRLAAEKHRTSLDMTMFAEGIGRRIEITAKQDSHLRRQRQLAHIYDEEFPYLSG